MPFKFSTLSGWNRRLTSTFIDIVQQLVTVIPTVCQYIASLYVNMLQHRNGVIDIIVSESYYQLKIGSKIKCHRYNTLERV